jgi:predicted SnoaL-like aldol condensation-catalyzing enzyme
VADPGKNRELVIRFYNAIPQQDYATLEALARPDYIQHNPNFETGIQGLINGLRQRPQRKPGDPPIPPIEFIRTIAEGDFVWTLRRMPLPPGSPPGAEKANVDIFRVQDGKVAEHWDYMETFPRDGMTPKHGNGYF